MKQGQLKKRILKQKKKTYQKTLDPSNKRDREENNRELQRLNVDTEKNKETDDIVYCRKYWRTVTEEGNGPKINDRARNNYNKGEIKHATDNYNKNIINK